MSVLFTCSVIERASRMVKQAKIKKPASKYMDELVAATEREVFVLPADVDCGDVFPCDEDVMDAIEEAEDSEDAVLSIRIEEADELENFEILPVYTYILPCRQPFPECRHSALQ